MAHAIARESRDADSAGATMTRLGLALFLSMNVMVGTMLLWSQPTGGNEAAAEALYGLFRHLALLLTTGVCVLLGGPLWQDALCEMRAKRLAASHLLLLGIGAAYLYSAVSVLTGGPVYFEVVCMVLVAVTLGRWLEAAGKLKTTSALRSLQNLLPDQARVLHDFALHDRAHPAPESWRPLAEVRKGDVLRVLPGERIPVDGRILRGQAALDEQLVTGESLAVVKERGDGVFSGTLNLDGDLAVEATARPGAGALEQLIEAVLAAAGSRTGYQKLADRVSAWFMPCVALVATGAFVAHHVGGNSGGALLAALAVLVIACPCALGLATPMAIWAAFGRAARHGVLFRDAAALDRLAVVRTVCFDKTGTLTTGEATLQHVFTHHATADEILRVAGALAQSSTHALSQAIVRHVGDGALSLPVVTEPPRTVAGRGLVGVLPEFGECFLGNERLLREAGVLVDALSPEWQTVLDSAAPVVFVAWRGEARGLLVFRESLRAGAASAVAALQARGLNVRILSGDRQPRVQALALELGVAAQGELLPQEKLACITRLRAEAPVLMVGDGLNDAPALATADVGLALGGGADVARHAAGICLAGNDLARIGWAIDLARAARRAIRWNLLWAFGYNASGMGLAAAGWLNPIIAALAMVVSSLLVVANSLRLAEDEETRALPSLPAVTPRHESWDENRSHLERPNSAIT